MQQVTIIEASENLHDLIEAALNGEEIIIMKYNKPAVKLTPVLPIKNLRQPGSAKGIITTTDDFDEALEDFKDY